MSDNKTRKITIRKGRLGEQDEKLLDYQYWDELGDEAKFEAAWELVIQAYEIKGLDINELRFQRSVEKLSKFSS
jgi:hypothetical protein